jgi:hypothetical protein
MLSFGSSLRIAAAAASCALVAPAYADAPPMTLTVSASGASGSFGKNIQVAPTSTSAGGVGTYIGSATGTNGSSSIWNCNYNFSAASGMDYATQSGSLSVTNTSGSDLSFALSLTLPTFAAQQMTGLFNGSVSVGLITSSATGGAGSLSPVSGTPMWVATTGGSPVGSLFNNWSTVARTTPGVSFVGSQSFGGSQPSLPTSSFGTNIAITFNFILSSGATASFSTALAGVGNPVPAPGALAVLAVAGIGSRRRRR